VNPEDRYLDLAQRIAHQSEQERNERLRSTDPALARALEEIVRIKLLGDDGEQGEKD
jgi:hypothetical protein